MKMRAQIPQTEELRAIGPADVISSPFDLMLLVSLLKRHWREKPTGASVTQQYCRKPLQMYR